MSPRAGDAPTNSSAPPGPSKSNGRLVRFVARCAINDGWLHMAWLLLVAVCCPPYLVYWMVKARRARVSWADTLFQLFSIGRPTTALDASREVDDPERTIRFVCLSDTHNKHDELPRLPMGDVLVHTGDFTSFGTLEEVRSFAAWLGRQQHPVKIVVPGNHDMIMHESYWNEFWSDWSRHYQPTSAAFDCFTRAGVRVLIDEVVEVAGVRIYGSPWTRRDEPWHTAFQKEREEMQALWDSVPGDVDVLLTHMPPLGTGDRDPNGERVGCHHLACAVKERVQPQIHVFGHVHSDAGVVRRPETTYVNAASICDFYMIGERQAPTFSVAGRSRNSH
mmetsp:Transcript_76401/g.212235  ORF Transcript_76401/g.212235 Transcript_76401/m.212235 type:complete len:334 (-) Transcript_76401:89-1090(-)